MLVLLHLSFGPLDLTFCNIHLIAINISVLNFDWFLELR